MIAPYQRKLLVPLAARGRTELPTRGFSVSDAETTEPIDSVRNPHIGPSNKVAPNVGGLQRFPLDPLPILEIHLVHAT